MRNVIRAKTVLIAFEGFHPRLWVLAFIALVFMSIAWLAFTQPPPIRPSFHSMFASLEQEDDAPGPHAGERTPLFTAGLRDPLAAGIAREFGDCVRTVAADVDGDGRVVLIASYSDDGTRSARRSTAAFELSESGIKQASGFGDYPYPADSQQVRLANKEETPETRHMK